MQTFHKFLDLEYSISFVEVEYLVFTLILIIIDLLSSKKPWGRVLVETTFCLLFNMVSKAAAGHKRKKKRARCEVKEEQQRHAI